MSGRKKKEGSPEPGAQIFCGRKDLNCSAGDCGSSAKTIVNFIDITHIKYTLLSSFVNVNKQTKVTFFITEQSASV